MKKGIGGRGSGNGYYDTTVIAFNCVLLQISERVTIYKFLHVHEHHGCTILLSESGFSGL
jgi:hypothetical protein